MRWLNVLVLVSCAAGCGAETNVGDAGGLDAARPHPGAACRLVSDCDDLVFCNGVETCALDGGVCRAGSPPCLGGATCDEAARRCRASCVDADGDGACASVDCDDANSARFPGNAEVCDARDVDEDCDPSTIGARDSDGDQSVDARCCNVAPSGARQCGDDCNDMASGVNPRVPEVCDRLDNDCDAEIDEGVLREFRPDLDGDGFASNAPGATVTRGCSAEPRTAELATDCDDTRSAVNPGNAEVCDAARVDENCDGMRNEACTCAIGATQMCCGTRGTQTCGSTGWGACSYVPVPEVCNGLDDNCVGGVDEGLRVACYRDGDNDGFGAGVRSSECRTAGRPGECPDRFSPNDTDCDDARGTTRPGGAEVCDGVDNDCDAMVDEGARLTLINAPTSALGACLTGGLVTRDCQGSISLFCSNSPALPAQAGCGIARGGVGPLQLAPSIFVIGCLYSTGAQASTVTIPRTTPGCSGDPGDWVLCRATIDGACAARTGFVGGVGPVFIDSGSVHGLCIPASQGRRIEVPYALCGATPEPTYGCNAAVNNLCASMGYGASFGPVQLGAESFTWLCLSG